MKHLSVFFFLLTFSTFAAAESDRPDLEDPFLKKPYVVKSMYRESWMADNIPDLSGIAQLELMQGNSPDLDPDTHKITSRGISTLKSMQFGEKDSDLSQKSSGIQENPAASAERLTQQIQPTKSPLKAFEVADTIEASERLNDRVDRQNKVGTKSYDIDMTLFK